MKKIILILTILLISCTDNKEKSYSPDIKSVELSPYRDWIWGIYCGERGIIDVSIRLNDFKNFTPSPPPPFASQVVFDGVYTPFDSNKTVYITVFKNYYYYYLENRDGQFIFKKLDNGEWQKNIHDNINDFKVSEDRKKICLKTYKDFSLFSLSATHKGTYGDKENH